MDSKDCLLANCKVSSNSNSMNASSLAEPHPAGSPAAMQPPASGGEQPKVSIRTAFAHKTVLITGATGYVGSLVLEQLLRMCPDVKAVYTIARDK